MEAFLYGQLLTQKLCTCVKLSLSMEVATVVLPGIGEDWPRLALLRFARGLVVAPGSKRVVE